MNIHFKDPSIKLIGSYDGRESAWRFSRPHIPANQSIMNDLRNLNLPVNGFAIYQFEIKGSLLFRDFLYATRPSHNWAKSSRAEYITEDNLIYCSEYTDIYSEDNKDFISEHSQAIDTSIPQDIRKNHFPYGFMSNFQYMVDARVLSNLMWSIKDTVFDNYYRLFKEVLDSSEIELVPHDNFKMQDNLRLPIEHINTFKDVDVNWNRATDLVTITAKMTGNLSSQFQRQESGIFKSELINKIFDAKSLSEVPISQNCLIWSQVTVHKNVAIKIASTRACWFAMIDKTGYGSWTGIVQELISELGLSTNPKSILPCKCDYHNCKWLANQLNTLKGGNPNFEGDVNTPCPFITGIPEIWSLRGVKMNSNSQLYQMWVTWLPKSDITEYGIEYLNNIAKYGYAEKRDNEVLRDETKKLLEVYKNYISYE